MEIVLYCLYYKGFKDIMYIVVFLETGSRIATNFTTKNVRYLKKIFLFHSPIIATNFSSTRVHYPIHSLIKDTAYLFYRYTG